MNEEHMKKFHHELAEYYQKGDCCTWIVELRKQVSEKDKEIERLKNNWNKLKDFINRNCFYDEDTLSYEELITEINLIEYGSDEK